MDWKITGGDAFPLVEISLEKGEGVKAESGAMVAMSSGVKLVGKVDGGIGRAMARMFSGESFFMQEAVAERGAGWILLASPVPGGVAPVEIKNGQELAVQKNGFLAATPGVQVSTKVQGIAKGLFSGEGFFVVKVSGSGTAFISTYGAIHTIDIPAGEAVMVDNGHLIAWDSAMKYDITKAATSWFSAATSGEGFGCRFHGPGRVFVQTRNPHAFGAWALPFLPIPRPQG